MVAELFNLFLVLGVQSGVLVLEVVLVRPQSPVEILGQRRERAEGTAVDETSRVGNVDLLGGLRALVLGTATTTSPLYIVHISAKT